jgi:phospholipase C
MPRQEKGTRPACALPYELYAGGKLNAGKNAFEIEVAAGNEIFGERSAGCPFTVYAPALAKNRNYSVAAGDKLTDNWSLSEFKNGAYFLTVHGPNGFFREFRGDAKDPLVYVNVKYDRLGRQKLSGNLIVVIGNKASSALQLVIKDNTYGAKERTVNVNAGAQSNVTLDLKKSSGWYDFTIKVAGHAAFSHRYAGHVETGSMSITDPAMGGVI